VCLPREEKTNSSNDNDNDNDDDGDEKNTKQKISTPVLVKRACGSMSETTTKESPYLTAEQIKTLKDVFDAISGSDGELQVSELETQIEKMQLKPAKEGHVKQMMVDFSAKKTGDSSVGTGSKPSSSGAAEAVLKWEEFEAIIQDRLRTVDMDEGVNSAFKFVDTCGANAAAAAAAHGGSSAATSGAGGRTMGISAATAPAKGSGDNKISVKELHAAFVNLMGADRITEQEVQDMMKLADEVKNGCSAVVALKRG